MHFDHAIGGNVIVIGDVMLDKYVSGSAYRISPEAPVPVIAVDSRRATLGGAGNVALNLVGLGCKAWLFGARGDDRPGDHMMKLLSDNDIRGRLDIDPDLPTTTKTRIMAGGQQLVRFDEEGKFNGRGGCYDALILDVAQAIGENDIGAVILSDYCKGVVSQDLALNIISSCRASNIPVLVDSKSSDWHRYTGATLAKPNISELEGLIKRKVKDDYDLALGAREAMLKYDFGAVLVTMGAKGMLLVMDGLQEFIPTQAREVFDVSGAGDTVIATLAAFLCSGYSIPAAARIANTAAGIVVGKVGTQPITIAELSEM